MGIDTLCSGEEADRARGGEGHRLGKLRGGLGGHTRSIGYLGYVSGTNGGSLQRQKRSFEDGGRGKITRYSWTEEKVRRADRPNPGALVTWQT